MSYSKNTVLPGDGKMDENSGSQWLSPSLREEYIWQIISEVTHFYINQPSVIIEFITICQVL